ncbi:MAG: Vi polysaccharide biosynthesis UDP-N-acetylglucosamine C-6 dehydrogenase TviB, partial [Leptonema sp. (in: Bacteria)]|nr:Vi polysaccharide biosynthesis UDP-N-acetylglucosamine C-6 dehydrogenase TviB [Leptonema sp. (in: bacteria)]
VKAMLRKRIQVNGSKVLVMGLTFKENCPDIRNTKVVDIIHELQDYGIDVDSYDPWVNPKEAQHEYGISPIEKVEAGHYDAIVLAVAHQQFKEMGASNIHQLAKLNHVLYDLKYILAATDVDLRL